MERKIYITSTWLNSGEPTGRIAKNIVVCDNWDEANKVLNGMYRDRSCGYVNWSFRKPYYSPNKYNVTTTKGSDYPNGWYPWLT